jgi:hypothetical protein
MGMATNPWPNYADWTSLPFAYTATYAPRPRVRRLRAERGERRRRSTVKERHYGHRDTWRYAAVDENRRAARKR